MIKSSFNLINASAGSGKTYSLVFNYLKELLSNSRDDHFRALLALTFTNKAVNEMKKRIVETLSDFVKEDYFKMREEISKQLNINELQLRKKSERVLKNILFNYAAFDILTLDSFTHRIVKTFSLELKLPKSFEIVVEQDEILKEIIQIIIEQVGVNNDITKSLVDFVNYKIDINNKESISDGLIKIARLILRENDRYFLKKLRNKSFRDYRDTQKKLNKIKDKEVENAKTISRKILDKIESQGLKESIFSRGMVIKHFSSIIENKFQAIYPNNLEKNLLEGKKVVKKTNNPKELIEVAESMIPEIYEHYMKVKKSLLTHNLIQEINKQWIPLSLMSEMEKTLNVYQIDNKKMLIGQFNEKISKVVQEHEAPFIYEKIGEKYKHFFIDEFQDTSRLQWSNLKPLLKHALESEDLTGKSGSVLLVGDPKQAIYRWRGGDVQMFLDLITKKKLDQIQIKTHVLSKNYRSLDSIVEFNNEFFKSALNSIHDLKYRNFYEKSFNQQNNNSQGGKVEIHFAEDKMDTVHEQKSIDAIFDARKEGFSWGSIAILVRTKKQVISIFEALSKTKIPVVSSESLLLKKSSSIKLILSILRLNLSPENSIERLNICRYYIEKNIENQISTHQLLKESLCGSLNDFSKFLQRKFDASFDPKLIGNSNFYELIEAYISSLGLLHDFDNHLEFFLDYCYDFSIQSNSSVYNFLRRWDKDSETLTIPLPEDNQAVRIMTIHVAKGLEFPVVILPYLYSDFQPNSRIKRQTWYPIEFKESKIDYGRINFSSRLESYGQSGRNISEKDKLENELDALNTLYVALTRASNKIIIITRFIQKLKIQKNYAQLFIDFILSKGYEPSLKKPFIFGSGNFKSLNNKDVSFKLNSLNPNINFEWKKLIKSDSYPNINEKRLKGILLHKLLSKIKFETDIIEAIDLSIKEGLINIEEKTTYSKQLKKIINHDLLNHLYKPGNKVYTEKEILLPGIGAVIPDRIVISKKNCSVIEYKTGKPNLQHKNQIVNYSLNLELILKLPVDSFLVYLNENIKVVETTNFKKTF